MTTTNSSFPGKNKKISVIIPANNEEKYIFKTLSYLINQDYSNYEVLIISNGCTDNTEKVVKDFIFKHNCDESLVTNYSCKISNVSLARNIGSEQAKGDLLLFLDADTLLESDSLTVINRIFSNKYSFATLRVKPDQKGLSFRMLMFAKNFMHTSRIYQGSSGVQICWKKQFDEINGFNENIVVKENKDLIRRLRSLGEYICINNYCTTSMRRFEEWGMIKAGFFWAKQWVLEFKGKLQKTSYEKVR